MVASLVRIKAAMTAGAFAAATSLAPVPTASAEKFPSRPLTFVVGYTAGGGSDTVARFLAEKVGAILGQRMIVDNRPGGNGNIALGVVARAAPDGHTILLGNFGPIAVNPSLYPGMRDDPEQSLAPITQIAGAPLAILVNAKLPAKTAMNPGVWARV